MPDSSSPAFNSTNQSTVEPPLANDTAAPPEIIRGGLETEPAPKQAKLRPSEPEAVVVGSGPNGLAAAITLARAGRCVWVYEAEDTLGGSVRSAELTLPGFIHDICSAVYPMVVSSPFFKDLELDDFGLQLIQPEAALAHPFDNGTAAILTHSLDETADQFGEDSGAVKKLYGPLVENWEKISDDILRPIHIPRHPFALAHLGPKGLRSAQHIAKKHFQGEKARAVFAGMAAHSILPLDFAGSASFGLVLWTMCH